MASWAGQTALVTGCSGFIGGWLSRVLCERAAAVVGIDQRPLRPDVAAAMARARFIRADIRDAAVLPAIFEQHRIDIVFHLAAHALPAEAYEDPTGTFEANARGTWNLLEAARTAPRVPKIVFSSSDSVYGENDGAPFTEESHPAPDFPYEASKACAELVARCYCKTYGVPIAIARFCNVYGPGDVTPSRLIAGTIAMALRGERQRLRGDGSSVRNYLYIEDAVRALLTLAEALDRPGIAGGAFNFCDESLFSVLDVVNHVLARLERPDLAPHLGTCAPGEISIKRASAERARTVLGWRATVDLDEGLRRTIEWHRNRPHIPAEAEAHA